MFDSTLKSYKNLKEYGAFSTPQGKIYYQEQCRLEAKFFEDCANQYGYTNNPKRGCLETLAWEKGHSSGYSEIHNWILILLPLIQ